MNFKMIVIVKATATQIKHFFYVFITFIIKIPSHMDCHDGRLGCVLEMFGCCASKFGGMPAKFATLSLSKCVPE